MNIMKGSVITKKIYSVILVVSIIISFSAAVLLTRSFNEKSEPETAVSLNCYRTPEEAIETELKIQDYKLLESNGTYIALCDINESDYDIEYVMNNGQGWQVVTEAVYENTVFYELEENGMYYIHIREYMGKNMIYIGQLNFMGNQSEKLDIKDNLDSLIVESQNTLVSGFDTYCWYWCIYEIPDDYTIKINDEIVFENGK